jgi:glucoamylase
MSACVAYGDPGSGGHHGLTLEEWIQKQAEVSWAKIKENIEHGQRHLGAAPGAVVASPGQAYDPTNREHQNYHYHWVRDAALVMHSFVRQLQSEQDPIEQSQLISSLMNYAQFSRRNQETRTQGGLGEPKFHLNGDAFDEPWGRPQNDGPALRAITLMDFLSSVGRPEENQWLFFDLIARDLDYVAHVLADPSFCLWEEVRGFHYFTFSVQRQALIQGAKLARYFGHGEMADRYLNRVEEITRRMLGFRAEGGIVVATLEASGGHVRDKNSGLDMAVILAVVYGSDKAKGPLESLTALDPYIQNTAFQLRAEFQRIYPLNQGRDSGFLVGRYPEDKYFGGNPWPVNSFGLAQFYYRVAREYLRLGRIEVTSINRNFFASLRPEIHSDQVFVRGSAEFREVMEALLKEGDQIVDHLRKYVGPEGDLSEQIEKESGYAVALPNLTWSHAAFRRMFLERQGFKMNWYGSCVDLLSKGSK